MRHASSCRARRPREDAGGDDDDDDGARADGMMHAMRRGDDLEWLRDPERCTANVLAAQAAERERERYLEPMWHLKKSKPRQKNYLQQ